MATVVTSSELASLLEQLGWGNNVNDLVQAILSNGAIPTAVIATYLQALLASPAGLDDQAIPGVTPQQGTGITNFLANKHLVGT